MKQRFTTVHDRYQVSDSCCGQLVWRVRWKNLEGWQYSPKTFTSVDKARKEADRIPAPWPIDIVPEVRS